MQRLDIGECEALRELEPGFPLGRAVVRPGPPLLVAMKAAGFGGDGILLRAVAKLRQSAASELQPSP